MTHTGGNRPADGPSLVSRGLATLFAVLMLGMGSAAIAADHSSKHFEIKAKPLAAALMEFGVQSGLTVVAPTTLTAGKNAPSVRGDLAPTDALKRLLKGSGLTFARAADGTIAVQAISPSGSGPVQATAGESGLDTDLTRRRELSEVVVTGSRIPSTSKYASQEVQIYDRNEIDASGQISVSDFLSTLPSVSASALSTALGIGSTVQLRGLPVGTTLVLLDGRRLETSGLADYVSGQTFFDLNNIPLAAVQRIEVDENGASAIYGSDALAGVVNIVLKKDFDGFAATTRYSWAKDLPEWHASVAWGRQWEQAGFSVVASYSKTGELTNTERELTASNDYTGFGGPDNNYAMCNRANVYSLTGAPLPGAPAASGATFAAVTGNTPSGRPSTTQFTYGALNECPIVDGLALQPRMYDAGVLMNGHIELSHSVELFSELLYTHLQQNQSTGFPSFFGVPGFQSFTVGASNPYNPFGTDVGLTGTLYDLPASQELNTDFFRPLVGVRGTFSQGWHWEVSAWQSSDWTEDTLPNLTENSAAIQNALDSSDATTALNPFVTGPEASAAVLGTLTDPGEIKWMGRDRSAEAFIRGPLVRLPAGNVQIVVGADYVRSALYANEINDGVDAPGTMYTYGRSYYAVFGEARVPLIGGRSRLWGGDLLTLTVSGRHDEYSDFGGATTGQVGLELRPVRSFLLRGTFGNAFQAPSLTDLYTPETTAPVTVVDPVTGEPTLTQVIVGGNPKLQPATGRSHTLGLVYSSEFVSGLEIGITQWQITENNAIQSLPRQVIVDNESLFPGRVIRDPTGAIQEVLDTDINFGTIKVSGMDYQLSYRHPVGRGSWFLAMDGTEMFSYQQALTPGTALLDVVSQAEDDGDWAPKWKATLSMGVQYGPLTGHVDGRYTGKYVDYDSASEIGNFWMVDAYLKWSLDGVLEDRLTHGVRADIELGATNLLNRPPQFSNYGFDFYGYDPAQMSIVGRTLYAGCEVHW